MLLGIFHYICTRIKNILLESMLKVEILDDDLSELILFFRTRVKVKGF